jgi:hypothetical protein
MAMRTVEGPCGVVLSGAHDELYRLRREHAHEHDADEGITDDYLPEHIRANARDAA